MFEEAIPGVKSGVKEEPKEEGGFIKWFSELSKGDSSFVGVKAANLAEMYNNNISVPAGFVVTKKAYGLFLNKNNLNEKIDTILSTIDHSNFDTIQKASKEITSIIKNSEMPQEIKDAVIDAYDVLDVDKKSLGIATSGALDILRTSHESPFVAIRSSPIIKNQDKHSFAGQHDNILNVKGNDDLIQGIKSAFASQYSSRAINYRKNNNLDLSGETGVAIQKMVDSEKSGCVFSKNPIRDDRNIIIEGVLGLGIGSTSGKILPDQYIMNSEYELVDKKVSEKPSAFVRNSSGDIERVNLTSERSKQDALTGHEIKMLAQIATRLENLFGKPQDIEFGIDSNGISILQSRPITTELQISGGEIAGNPILSGTPASGGFASGTVKIIEGQTDLDKVQNGDVIVTDSDVPSAILQKASAIITNQGGVTSQAAIVAREKNIPLISGTKTATDKLKDGDNVSVDGFMGKVVQGVVSKEKIEIQPAIQTKTNLKLTLETPEFAEKAAESGIKELGVVRIDKIVSNSGRHAVWYLKNNKLEDYIALIHRGIKRLSKPYNKIWIRTSNMRSDHGVDLEGAPETEKNPMLGFHGIRFSLKNQDLLEAEFKVVKELADEFPEKNFGIMLPKIITVDELRNAKIILQNIGIPENVNLGIVIETPASVQIINSLCEEGVAFVNLDLKNLTQHTLAIDKDNEEVNHLHDEMNPAVTNSMKYVIRRCKKYGVETCAWGLENKDIIQFFIESGIDSLSVSPGSLREISEAVSHFETSPSEPEPTSPPKPEDPDPEPEPEKPEPKKPEPKPDLDEEDLILKALGNSEPEPDPAPEEPEPDPAPEEPEPDPPEEPDPLPIKENKEVFSSETIENLFNQEVIKDISQQENQQEAQDEYSPGLGSDSGQDIPPLNEAIPIDSQTLEEPEPEIEEDLDTEEEIVDILDDELEEPTRENIVFEEQQEAELDKDIEKEASEFEQYQAQQEKAKKAQQTGSGNSEDGDDQVLDIF